MDVKIVNKSRHKLPEYATRGSAGFDIRANFGSPDMVVCIKSKSRVTIPTGIHVQLPEGYELQIRPRSGMAHNHGITVVNSPGTVDCDYTGEIRVILINHGDDDFMVNDGDRIAQCVVAKYERVNFVPVDSLCDTERGDGGIGHTGVN